MDTSNLNYRDLLRDELLARCKKNPAYSARSFSRDIGVSPGFLTQLFQRRKRLNLDRASRISDALRWSAEKRRVFTTLVRYEKAKEVSVKREILGELNEASEGVATFQDVSIDRFYLISEWHHYAILELSKVDGFRADPKWIARRLGLTAWVAEDAVLRLLRLGLLVADEDGNISCPEKNYSTGDVPAEALKIFHRGILDKAKGALDTQTSEERNFSSITMAIDPKNLPRAAQMIRKFRRELMTYLESGEQKQIYQLSVQLFRMDEPAEKGGEG